MLEKCENILQNFSHNLKEKVLGIDICRLTYLLTYSMEQSPS